MAHKLGKFENVCKELSISDSIDLKSLEAYYSLRKKLVATFFTNIYSVIQ